MTLLVEGLGPEEGIEPRGFFPNSVMLTNGNYVVSRLLIGFQTQLQIYLGDGTPLGTPISVPAVGYHRLEALTGGGFVLFYTTTSEARVRIFDESGALTSGDLLLGPIDYYSGGIIGLTELANGGFAAAWRNSGTTTVKTFDAAGNPVATLATSIPVEATGHEVIELDGGNLLVIWHEYDSVSPFSGGYPDGYQVSFQMFTADGVALTEKAIVNQSQAGSHAQPNATALAGGGFVVTWVTDGTAAGDGAGINAQIFDANGAPVGSNVKVSDLAPGWQTQPDVAPLSWGGFLVSWSDSSSGNPLNFYSGIRAQLFDSDGNRVGQTIQVNQQLFADEVTSSILITSDNEARIFYHAGAGGTADPVGIVERVIALPDVGTTGQDSLTGSAGADRISGLSGDDVIDGGDGDDALGGDGGNDTLRGGNGADWLGGGAGNDWLDGEAGADRLFGEAGDDTFLLDEGQFAPGESINGGTGNDTLFITYYGGTLTLGALALTGVEGLVVDSFSGPFAVTVAQLSQFTRAEGSLRLTGSGAVALAGTTFGGISGRNTTIELDQAITSFTFNSATGADVGVYAGDGGVTITGGLGDDGLVGGAGADVLSGGAGSDGLNGGAGDHLFGGAGNDSIYVSDVSSAGIVVDGGADYDILYVQGGSDSFTLDQLTISGVEELNGSVRTSAALLGTFDRVYGYFTITDAGQAVVPATNVVDGTVFTLLPQVTRFDLSGATYSNTGLTLNLAVNVIGSSADDYIIGLTGANQIEGNGGNDTLIGGSLYDALDGGEGNDQLFGGDSGDQLSGGTGRDELHGGNGNDSLYIDEVSDIIAGEIYDGGADTDRLLVGYGAPSAGLFDLTGVSLIGLENLGGGQTVRLTGAQLLAFQSVGGRVQLADSGTFSLSGMSSNGLDLTLADGGSTLDVSGLVPIAPPGYWINVTIRGGAGSDTITAGEGLYAIYGGDGDDTLVAGLGVTTLFGDGGNDRLVVRTGAIVRGGDGFDTLVVNQNATINVGPAALSSIEAIELTAGANLTLSTSQLMSGLAFNTQISGSGTITINLEAGVFAAISGFQNAGGTVNFVYSGSAGGDNVKAGHFLNTISGGVGVDFLRGGNLVDTIDGGADRDKITGWGGADVLTGGAGNDQFRYLFATDSGVGAAADRITDFTIGSDLIDLRLLDSNLVTPDIQNYALNFIGSAAFGASGASQIRYGTAGADMLVQFDLDGNGSSDMEIVLQGLAGQTLSASDFMFTLAGAEPLSAKDAAPEVMDQLVVAVKLPAEDLAGSDPLPAVSVVDPFDFPDHGLIRWPTSNWDWLPVG